MGELGDEPPASGAGDDIEPTPDAEPVTEDDPQALSPLTEWASADDDQDTPDAEPEPASEPAQPAVPALPDPLPPEPKRAGRGATRDSWADYAAALHLNVTEDQSRDDIIEMVDAHLAQFPQQD